MHLIGLTLIVIASQCLSWDPPRCPPGLDPCCYPRWDGTLYCTCCKIR